MAGADPRGTSPLLLSRRVIHTQFPRRCQHRPQLMGLLGQACAVTQGWRAPRGSAAETRAEVGRGERAGGRRRGGPPPPGVFAARRVWAGASSAGMPGGPAATAGGGGRRHPTQPQAPFPT